MSAIYNPEPPTKGAVTLHTTHGPLDIRLWSAEAPLAARNFVQHCLDGTYDDLPFHRIVPSVLAQTGDPDGSGDGGRAALGEHENLLAPRNTRLRFRRRGLVAFVADQPSRAFRSQFFVTLAAADWLDEEGHPIFGHVFGDTVYNALNLAAHGPVEDVSAASVPRVTGVTVVESPFPDLVPRPRAKPAAPAQAEPAKPKRAATRSDRLLSFRNDDDDSDDDDDDDDAVTNRSKRSAGSSATAPPRRMRPAGGSRHERPPPPARPAPGPKRDAAQAASTGASKTGTEARAAVVADANDEFERLKAEMLGTAAAAAGSASAVGAAGAAGAAAAGTLEAGQGRTEAAVSNGSGKAPATQSARRRKRVDESVLLSKIKAFEGRVMSSRRKGDGSGAAWYSSALRLPKGIDDNTDYEIVEGPPPIARGPPGAPVHKKRR